MEEYPLFTTIKNVNTENEAMKVIEAFFDKHSHLKKQFDSGDIVIRLHRIEGKVGGRPYLYFRPMIRGMSDHYRSSLTWHIDKWQGAPYTTDRY